MNLLMVQCKGDTQRPFTGCLSAQTVDQVGIVFLHVRPADCRQAYDHADGCKSVGWRGRW